MGTRLPNGQQRYETDYECRKIGGGPGSNTLGEIHSSPVSGLTQEARRSQKCIRTSWNKTFFQGRCSHHSLTTLESANCGNHPEALGSRDHRLNFVRKSTFVALAVNAGGHVIVGLARLHRAIGVRGACIERRIDLGIRSTGLRPAVNVVPVYLGSARVPGQVDAMLRRCDTGTVERLHSRRIRRIAYEGCCGRRCPARLWCEGNGERLALTRRKSKRESQAGDREFRRAARG